MGMHFSVARPPGQAAVDRPGGRPIRANSRGDRYEWNFNKSLSLRE